MVGHYVLCDQIIVRIIIIVIMVSLVFFITFICLLFCDWPLRPSVKESQYLQTLSIAD